MADIWGDIDKGSGKDIWADIEAQPTKTSLTSTPQSLIKNLGKPPLESSADRFMPGFMDFRKELTGYGPPTSALDAVGQGFGTLGKEAAGAWDVAKALPSMVLHPVNTFYDAPLQMKERARQEAERGEIYNSMVHSAAAAIPFAPGAVGTGEMIGTPETPRAVGQIAGTVALPLVTKGIKAGAYKVLPPDIALEMANKFTRGALGTKTKNFEHGAAPDEVSGNLGIQRSQGRLKADIRKSKAAEFDNQDTRLSSPEEMAKSIDPTEATRPVIDDALSRANAGDTTTIQEFNNQVLAEIKRASSGSMRLNTGQLNKLRQWVDGYITKHALDPSGTVRDLAQNTFKALRAQLEYYSPETSEANQRIQSYIEAEKAIADKINRPPPPARTTIGEMKNLVPDAFATPARTGLSSLLRRYAGQPPQGVPPSALFPKGGLSDLPPELTEPPQSPLGYMGFRPGQGEPIPNFGQPAPMPWAGSEFPPSQHPTPPNVPPMAGFEPGTPPVPGGGPPLPAPTGPMPPVAPGAMQARTSVANLGEPPPVNMEGPPNTPPDLTTAPTAQDLLRLDAEAKVRANQPPRGSQAGFTPPLSTAQAGEITANPPEMNPEVALRAQLPAEPTEFKPGQQVGGFTKEGNMVAGELVRYYPDIDISGKPVWKALVADHRTTGAPIPVDVTTMFDRVKGPKTVSRPPVEKPASAPTKAESDSLKPPPIKGIKKE